jgi:transcriptional regulator with GAF, ATPase, and Fis domain
MRLERSSYRQHHSDFRESRHAEPTDLIGSSEALRHVRVRLEQVACTDATVLLLGETGTGKGLAAHLVHRLSPRRAARFVSVDCASLPSTLVESELFGRERGAFTDAHSAQAGRFEVANHGTIFLDEIGELPTEAQAKLLRVLQQSEFERLGSPRTIRVDVRVVAATNRNLADEVKAGRFRRDLYYRLSVFPISLPPLRERLEDLPALVHHMIERLSRRYQKRVDAVSQQLLAELATYHWPGNVRELENVLERAFITTPDSTLRLAEPLWTETLEALPVGATTALVDVERAHILGLLRANKWRIEGRKGAATALGLKPSTLRSRMQKLGVRRTVVDISGAGSIGNGVGDHAASPSHASAGEPERHELCRSGVCHDSSIRNASRAEDRCRR